jgi:EmrB/QacA subfamily drug resistance transporter
VLIAAILASALGFIDGTVVPIALPAMRLSLDADLLQAQWIHNAYMLTLSALILVGGALGDRLGLARMFAFGIGLFIAASMACALAPTAQFMIIARAVQGIGAAIMVPGSLAIISRAYPKEDRGRAIGVWASASALTTAAGPILGGAALSLGGPEMWRWIFAVNLPLGGVALWLLLVKVRATAPATKTPVDIGGAVLATVALGCLAWALTSTTHNGGGMWLWLAGAALTSAAFLWVEARAAHPMMPLTLFRNATFSGANVMAFTLYSALNLALFFLPMTLIAGWGIDPFMAAASFAPLAVFLSLFSARAGRLADQIGPRPLLIAGNIIAAIGYLLLGYLAPAQNLWLHVLPAMCVVAMGMACVVAPLSTAIMKAVPDEKSGVASGINNAVTRVAGLVSVAAVGGFLVSLYTGAGGQGSFGVPSDTPGHAEAMTVAFQGLAFMAAGLAGIGALTAFLVQKPAD